MEALEDLPLVYARRHIEAQQLQSGRPNSPKGRQQRAVHAEMMQQPR